MIFDTSFKNLLLMQTKYGKRKGMSFSDWIIKKRTLSIAAVIISRIAKTDFYELEMAIYFRNIPNQYDWFIKSYAIAMEEAAIHPEKFASGLDDYLKEHCITIEKELWYRKFYDFCVLILKEYQAKCKQGYKSIVSAYISLLMQQATYFMRTRIEDTIYGITEAGQPLFRKGIYPYIDIGIYDLEKDFIKDKNLSPRKIYDTFQKYGYDIHSLAEWELLNNMNMTYDNNVFRMAPYIDERTAFVAIDEPYVPCNLQYPRIWKSTDIYRERLKTRNYLLPSSGIIARYVNAGDIKEIRFIETLYDSEIIMLYRITTHRNGQLSGYYCTKEGTFYSIYEDTIGEMHGRIKNFILENYMLLTCDYEIKNKKNYAILQTENLDSEFHYPNQPLVSFKYPFSPKSGKVKKTQARERIYRKEDYQEEIKERMGFIRKLPVGQRASDAARLYAEQLGFQLAEGKTYVRSHTYRVYRKLEKNI